MGDFKLIEVPEGPHATARVFAGGNERAPIALVLLHGRGGNAADILTLGESFKDQCFLVAPEAVLNEWYPQRFIAPQAENEPHLSSALSVVAAVIASLEVQGFDHEHIVLAGFSQGACLAAEYVKRHPTRFAGVVLMSGGLIGSDAEVGVPASGFLQGVPVYLGSDVDDAHIPYERVTATRDYFVGSGAAVRCELFTNYGHAPHPTAYAFLQTLIPA